MLITPTLWNFQRVLHTLAATQQVPGYTRLHSRGSTSVPPTSRGAPLPPPSSRGGILSPQARERFPAFPLHLKRRRSPPERREGLKSRATIPRYPRCLSPFHGSLFSRHCINFQAEDRLTRRWHMGHHCGKATWESLVESLEGKPLILGYTGREA